MDGYIASFEDLYEIILQAKLKLDTKIKEANEKFPNNLESVNGGQDSMLITLIMLIRDHMECTLTNSSKILASSVLVDISSNRWRTH
ncbi:hypothetical protein LXL04_011716 [Taraxacum kok-saghyz]